LYSARQCSAKDVLPIPAAPAIADITTAAGCTGWSAFSRASSLASSYSRPMKCRTSGGKSLGLGRPVGLTWRADTLSSTPLACVAGREPAARPLWSPSPSGGVRWDIAPPPARCRHGLRTSSCSQSPGRPSEARESGCWWCSPAVLDVQCADVASLGDISM
jgi:hypothetical protein